MTNKQKYSNFTIKASSEVFKAGDLFDEEGAFENTRFQSPDGFIIASFKIQDGEKIICKGNVPGFVLGAPYRITGKVINDPNWGIQVNISSATAIKPTSSAQLVSFLGSGAIKGVGPVTAKKIVKTFGEDTLDILENSPERLIEVPGIGQKHISHIVETLPMQLKNRETISFFAELGVSVKTINRLIEEYGPRTKEIIQANPYILCKVRGFAFTRADSIAMKMNISKTDPNRIQAGIIATLRWMCDNEGHTVVPKDMLIEKTLEKLDIENASTLVGETIETMNNKKQIRIDELGCHLNYLYKAEQTIIKCFRNGCENDVLIKTEDIDLVLEEQEKINGYALTDTQRDGVHKTFNKKISILSGAAGSGKTLVCKSIVNVAHNYGMSVCLMAPTGRAAKHLADVCGTFGYTMHRALSIVVREEKDDDFFSENESISIHSRNITNAVDHFNAADIVIVDETSMMDTEMAAILFKACQDKHLVLVGDPNQLPSVGPGKVLHDLLNSDTARLHKNVTELTQVFRQQSGSPVISAANAVLDGKSPCYIDGVTFIEAENEDLPKIIENIVVPIIQRKQLSYDQWMLLSPMKKTPYSGVNALNNQMRPFINSYYQKPDNEKLDYKLQRGDLVMQTKNNYEVDIYNGDIGIVQSVDQDYCVEVLFSGDDSTVIFESDESSQLVLANALTIHKSQGGQADTVFIVLTSSHFPMLNRNLLYTAITRSEKNLILIGDKKSYAMAASNIKDTKRMTSLCVL